jgi:hypothetical protein
VTIPYNSGELVGRLARALGVRGQFSVPLDAGASPVVPIFDLTGAPFRRNGFRIIGRKGLGALAGNFNTFLVQPLTSSGVTLVVDSLILTNDNAAAAKYVIGVAPAGANPAPSASGPWSLELGVPSVFTVGNVPIGIQMTQQAGTLLSAGLTDIWVQPSQTVILPLDYTVPDGMSLLVETNVVNSALAVAVYGRVFLPQ